jgi:Trk K+ transport system NAD-binding subunit
VAEPDADGFLIIGSNPVARVLAKAIYEQGFRVVLADTSWSNISTAKLEGLPTYYGNPISEHAAHHLNLTGIGRMLALSAHENMNVSAMMHYRTELGPHAVFTIQSKGAKRSRVKRTTAAIVQGKTLFGEDMTYAKLAGMISRGAEIEITRLTNGVNHHETVSANHREKVLLFAIDEKNQLHLAVEEKSFTAKAGWQLISLVGPGESGT